MSETSKLIDNWWVFPGFEIEVVATGLELPVNLAFVPQPDKRPGSPLFYVTELYGQVKAITNDWQVHTYADRLLNYEPDHRFPGTGESGLIGICVEPRSGDLFLSMIYEEEGDTKGKLVRTSGKDRLRMDSLTTVIDDIPSVKAAHQIQAVTIGLDGKLYVNVGDGMIDPNVAQDDNDLRGKILRMNLDGSVPEDNPTLGSLVYAKGLRNPFGAVWRKSDGALYISDNGPEQDDRIARVEPGGNYGWPESMRRNSLFVWEYCQAPTAIDFMQGGQFPPQYEDELFVALFGAAYQRGRAIKGKKIVKMRLNDDRSGISSYDEFITYVGDGPASPCGLAFGPDALYFTDLHGEGNGLSGKPGGSIYRVSHTDYGRRGKMRVPDTNENWEKCICGDCPSMNDCMKEKSEGLFCARGKTSCQFERKGCICGECPVTSELKLSGLYYCDAGAAQ
ncbi:MAG: PQQ-dependent sugar dehydrogenase [Dehalococcoidia bacterium]